MSMSSPASRLTPSVRSQARASSSGERERLPEMTTSGDTCPFGAFFNMVEEFSKKGTERFVFKPNDANTWTKVKTMIENFLINQWRAGALATRPDKAFFVKVGLGQTMTPQDVLEGLMIVEIGMAAVRPAEFIILRFSHKLQEA